MWEEKKKTGIMFKKIFIKNYVVNEWTKEFEIFLLAFTGLIIV